MNYSHFTDIKVEKFDRVALITMNRPDTLNAFDEVMHREIAESWSEVGADPDVNAIVVTGAGKAFSAGGNIKKLVDDWDGPELKRTALQSINVTARSLTNLLNVRQPLIAAIQGDAMGIGATIGLFADISIISETARLADTHVKIGLAAGDGGAAIWPLLVGPNRAKELLMRGGVLKGMQAKEIGLVNYAVPTEQVLTTAMELAQELAALPPVAVRLTKAAVNNWLKTQVNLVATSSAAYQALTFFTDDYGEAIHAFVEKRKPIFKGS